MPAAYLMTMPLHAITEVYGEPGLRDRFTLEIADFAEPGRTQLLAALALAEDLHRDDRRVREPYLNHLLRVAIRILRYYGVHDPDVLIAALLHDSVEDHPAELAALGAEVGPADRTPVADGLDGADRLDGADGVDGVDGADRLDGVDGQRSAALAVLAARFGPRVAGLVQAVTNPEYDLRRDVYQQYREHLAASLDRNPWARVIKVSDFTDNGVGVIHTTGPKVNSSATKYRPLVPLLRELIARPDTPLSPAAKQHIFDQLDLAEERFAAILDR